MFIKSKKKAKEQSLTSEFKSEDKDRIKVFLKDQFK